MCPYFRIAPTYCCLSSNISRSDKVPRRWNLGPFPSPSTVPKGDFLCERRRSTSPSPNRWLPQPPPAAPAAGGRGNPDSRCVHSVGLLSYLAGGAEEVTARSVFLLQVEVSLFGGGAPRSSAAGLLPLPRSQLCGPVERGFPLRRMPWDGGSGVDDIVQEAVEVRFGDDGVRWCRSFAADDRRLPVRSGVLSIQVMESMSGGAPPTAPRTKTESICSRVWTVISIFLRTFL